MMAGMSRDAVSVQFEAVAVPPPADVTAVEVPMGVVVQGHVGAGRVALKQ